MTSITGGIVSVEDGTKKNEEYAPPRKVRVELHFAVPEGSDEGQQLLDSIAALAEAKVREMLGAKPKAPQMVQVGADPAPKTTGSAAQAAHKAEVATPTAVGKTKADLAAEAGLVETAPKAGPKRASAKPKAPAADVLEPSATADDGLGDILGEAPPAEITDLQMNTAAQKKNAELKAPQRIRELTAKFTPEGKAPSLAGVPHAVRDIFLKELDALK